MEQAERIVLLCIGLLFESVLVPILWVMLVLTVATAIQRFVKVWRQAGVAPVVMERRAAAARGSGRGLGARCASTTCAVAASASPDSFDGHGPGSRVRPHRPARLPGGLLAARTCPSR